MYEHFAIELRTDKPFDSVVADIERLVPEHQFRVLAVHDVKATLAEKGFERGDLKIIEICNAGFAHQALMKNTDVALFMPCRFTVHVEDGKTIAKLNRPSMIAQMMPDSGLEDLAMSVEKTMKKILQEAI